MQAILKTVFAFPFLLPAAAFTHASSKTVDTIADWLAIFVIIVVPIAGVAVVQLIHVLPEKIAERNHLPQKAAMQTLCFLSLVFGGLQWPIAWLWMFLKPLKYRFAYGTDKHDDYFIYHALGGGFDLASCKSALAPGPAVLAVGASEPA